MLDDPAALPDGTEVSVRPLKPKRPEDRPVEDEKGIPSLYEQFKPFIGIVSGPPDWAENHDHYVHGRPKK